MNLNQALRQFILLCTFSLVAITGTNAVHAAGPTAKLTITASGTGRGTFSPNDNGKSLTIGKDYTIKAIAAAGCQFSDWILSGTTNASTNPTAKLTFQMVSNLVLTADFADIQAPTVTITTKKSTGSNSVVAIIGTAKDNIGVASVWCQAGSGGWNLATTSDAYTNWLAIVILSSGTNTIKVYAEDAAGNRSKTNSVGLTDDSTGLAPESIAGTTLQLVVISNGNAVLSFGGSTFSQLGSGTVNTGVGIYTYSLTNASTGLLAKAFTAPPATVSNTVGGDVITLSFTTGASGTFTDTNGASGTFTLSEASSTVPALLSGLTLQGTNTGTNVYQFTNVYGEGIFTTTNTISNSSGAYTFAQYSSEVGLVEENFSDGATNYVLLNFSADSNTYYSVSIDSSNDMSTNAGTFSVTGETSTAGYTGPISLAGLTGAVTEIKTNGTRKSFEISFGASTFGQFTASTDGDTSVGSYTWTRTGAKTGLFLISTLAPPDEVTNAGTSLIPFSFINSRTANFTNSHDHGTITLSEPASTVPLSLAGRELKGGSGGYAFGLGTFTGKGEDNEDAGTYTYAVYGPQVAMVAMNFTAGSHAGTTRYLELWFSSATSGSFSEDKGSGNTDTGTFSMK